MPRTKADPFGDDADEAQSTPAKTTTAKNNTKEKNVSDNNETPDNGLSVTLKAGAGYNAPWTVVRANTPAEMVALLEDPNLVDVLRESAKLAEFYGNQMPEKEGKAPSGGGGGRSGGSGGRGGNSGTPEWADGLTPPECDHGDMQPRQGFKNGSMWKAWMCPAPKGATDQCKPEWVRDR